MLKYCKSIYILTNKQGDKRSYMASITCVPTYERTRNHYMLSRTVSYLTDHGIKESIIRLFYIEHDRNQNKV